MSIGLTMFALAGHSDWQYIKSFWRNFCLLFYVAWKIYDQLKCLRHALHTTFNLRMAWVELHTNMTNIKTQVIRKQYYFLSDYEKD